MFIGHSWATFLAAAALALELVASAARAAPPRVEDAEANLTITLGSERLGWGEELEVTVSATNLSGRKQSGGIDPSFDFDVIILAATDARILQPGAVAYDLRSSSVRPLARPLVEVWIADWSPQAEHKMVVTVLPLVSSRLRVLARTTMLQSGSMATLSIHPSRTESRSLDEQGFPSRVGYVDIARRDGLRRAIRRFGQRVSTLDTTSQGRFAQALADELENPNGLVASSSGSDPLVGLKPFVPTIVGKLRRDPAGALEKLICLMTDLSCESAAVYFGVPFAVYAKVGQGVRAQDQARRALEAEKGGDVLVSLLEAEGASFEFDEKSGDLSIEFGGRKFKSVPGPGRVVRVLDDIVAANPANAAKPHPDAGGMSFTALHQQLRGGGTAPR